MPTHKRDSAQWEGISESTRRGWGPGASEKKLTPAGVGPPASKKWSREEWDVALADGAMYRIFRDEDTGGWFIDAIVD